MRDPLNQIVPNIQWSGIRKFFDIVKLPDRPLFLTTIAIPDVEEDILLPFIKTSNTLPPLAFI